LKVLSLTNKLNFKTQLSLKIKKLIHKILKFKLDSATTYGQYLKKKLQISIYFYKKKHTRPHQPDVSNLLVVDYKKNYSTK
jgi:hypothetical protein